MQQSFVLIQECFEEFGKNFNLVENEDFHVFEDKMLQICTMVKDESLCKYRFDCDKFFKD